MDKATEPKPSPAGGEPRQKDSKTSKLTIHEERTVTIMTPPQVVVQNLVIHPHVVSTVSVRPTAMALVGLAILARKSSGDSCRADKDRTEAPSAHAKYASISGMPRIACP